MLGKKAHPADKSYLFEEIHIKFDLVKCGAGVGSRRLRLGANVIQDWNSGGRFYRQTG